MSAFVEELGITKNSYFNYGLSDCYWSSSQCGTSKAWSIDLSYGFMGDDSVDAFYCIRLGSMF